MVAQIQQRGFSVGVLPSATEVESTNRQGVEKRSCYEAWLRVDWETDAAQTTVGLGRTTADWLIVDHYALDARWEQALRPMCRNLMVIDDLADRIHDCDLLLDQNLGRNLREYSLIVDGACNILVGPQYALLRPEFGALREESLKRHAIPQLKHMLIAMGGVDQADVTGKVLVALQSILLRVQLRITVVMGPHAPWLKKVQQLAEKMSVPVEIKCNVRNMAQVMADSDLAIGAAGSTAWERCCLGLPSIIGAVADNQIFIANALQNVGASKLFIVDDEMTTLRASLAELLDDPVEISKMSARTAAVTDGAGTKRVVERILAIQFSERM
jgi:UDP-2,4-diacetamido-2,4,6-trideoxy-beta-L-altropyranose hydrolase